MLGVGILKERGLNKVRKKFNFSEEVELLIVGKLLLSRSLKYTGNAGWGTEPGWGNG